MFGKIKYISDNNAVVEINKYGNVIANLMNLHVVFENAEPQKSMYRKVRIKTIEGNDDFHCLQEVLSRRLEEFEKQKKDKLPS